MSLRSVAIISAVLAIASLAQAGIPIPSTMDGFVIGNPSAPVQFELFGDTMCPDTKAAYPTVRAVAANYGPDKLRLVFHALSLPFTHTSWLTNLGLWVVATANPKNAFPYIELIFANQDSYWNHVTNGNTTNEIVSSIGALTEAKGLMGQADFIAGMNNATLSFLASSSWKYIVTRGVANTPTFFVNGVTVDADPTWTASDWEQVLDPLYGLARRPAPPAVPTQSCRDIVAAIQTQANNTCPSGDSPCQYLPGKWQCCKPGIYCVPNVGCECSEPLKPEDCARTLPTIQTQANNTCPVGDSPCQYLPGKWQCCKPGIYCVPNVGCECAARPLDPEDCARTLATIQTQANNTCPVGDSPCQYLPGKWQCCKPGIYCVPNVGCECSAAPAPAPSECVDRELMPVSSDNSTCPSGETSCEYLPNKYQCCYPGEFCIKNVGCSCMEDAKAVPCEAREDPVPTVSNSTCPSGETSCEYLPSKYQCCYPGEFCIKNVGCSCMEDEPIPAACGRELMPVTSDNSTCPSGETSCEYLPNKYQCCYPGEFCIKNVGCSCMEDAAPVECAAREDPVPTLTNSTCPSGETSCEYLPNKYQCCYPGEFCIKNVGCSCMDNQPEPEPAAVCVPRAEPVPTVSNSTCPSGETSCEYLPNKYQCCYPGEFCIKNVGCSCMEDDPVEEEAAIRFDDSEPALM